MLLSFIIPVYNGADFLKECVDSIECNHGDFEILLIDDGSTDTSFEICKNISKQYNNVNVIHRKHSGVSITRNYGIKNCTGKYIAFVDQDDYVASTFVKSCEQLDKYFPDAVYFKWKGTILRTDNVDNDIGCSNETNDISFYSRNDSRFLVSNLLHCTDPRFKGFTLVFPWGGFYRKDFLIENDIYFNPDVVICEDVWFNVSVLKNAAKIITVDSTKYYYYYNKYSAGKAFNKSYAEISISSNELIKKLLDDYFFDPNIKYAYEYSVLYRYWWCVYAYFYHVENSDSIFSRATKMRLLAENSMYQAAFLAMDAKMICTMDFNMKIVLIQIQKKRYLLASIICKCRIVLRRLMYMKSIFEKIKNKALFNR